MKMKKAIFSLLLIAILSIGFVACGEAEPDVNWSDDGDVISILFVGNSFTFQGDVPGQLQTLAGAQGVEIQYIDISRGGATLNDSRRNAIREMERRQFDYVVLQDQSMRPGLEIDDFLNDVEALSDAARANGVTPVLFSPAVSDDFEIQNILTEIYQFAAEEFDAILINAGGAWVYAYQIMPGLVPDKGGNQAFLAACVFAGTLFDLQITDIPETNSYTGNDTISLAQIAWDFVHSSR